ncbi:metal-dependent transcriptional regulator [Halobacterium sp. MBLA0001]|uniref:metal-dependent transcriptional regulator n=1 Tax=Halobacterium TaxID=2239 RepID=UPI001F1AA77A|nr:metal-dependent transcriptional regulator [Halobacterium salinarum]MCF2207985.1 metal-dependent transcriptional regulator [Halobacterium salinarum]MDL0124782.1 metal-dependent transcriptional regulator [Halobacterium salinarum]MDL0135535.1 metal-dependent transcriptional regulator [Halobacterium salinarum]
MPAATVSRADNRYLTAIFIVGTVEDCRAETGAVAAELDVSPSTVTERFRDLAARDLVDYERYQGATLTDRGERIARTLAWKRCLAHHFSADELDLPADTADELGGALSADAAAALREHIDHPCGAECRAPAVRLPECTVYSTASR